MNAWIADRNNCTHTHFWVKKPWRKSLILALSYLILPQEVLDHCCFVRQHKTQVRKIYFLNDWGRIYIYIFCTFPLVVCLTWETDILKSLGLTFASLLLRCLPATVAESWHWFDVALADRWRMQNQFGRSSQTHRQSSSTHQDSCDPCVHKKNHSEDKNKSVAFSCENRWCDDQVCICHTSQRRVDRTGSIEILHRDSGHTATQDTDTWTVHVRSANLTTVIYLK